MFPILQMRNVVLLRLVSEGLEADTDQFDFSNRTFIYHSVLHRKLVVCVCVCVCVSSMRFGVIRYNNTSTPQLSTLEPLVIYLTGIKLNRTKMKIQIK